jgi:hypothetical protein
VDPSAFRDAARRYAKLVIDPEQEWNLIGAQNPSLGEVVFPFTVMGLVASTLLALLGIVLRIGQTRLALELLAHVVVEGAAVAAFAAVAGAVARRADAVRPRLAPAAALYSATGMWIGALFAVIPIPELAWIRLLAGTLYTAFLFHRASETVVGVPGHARAWALGAPLAALVVTWSAVRGLFEGILRSLGAW